MAGIFKYKYQLLPADYEKFIKLYKEDHPKIIIKYDRKEAMYYAFKKSRKELEWKYDRDEYQLYIDEPIKNYFFKKFLNKETKIMKKSEIREMIKEEIEKLNEVGGKITYLGKKGSTIIYKKHFNAADWKRLLVSFRAPEESEILVVDYKDVGHWTSKKGKGK